MRRIPELINELKAEFASVGVEITPTRSCRDFFDAMNAVIDKVYIYNRDYLRDQGYHGCHSKGKGLSEAELEQIMLNACQYHERKPY